MLAEVYPLIDGYFTKSGFLTPIGDFEYLRVGISENIKKLKPRAF